MVVVPRQRPGGQAAQAGGAPAAWLRSPLDEDPGRPIPPPARRPAPSPRSRRWAKDRLAPAVPARSIRDAKNYRVKVRAFLDRGAPGGSFSAQS